MEADLDRDGKISFEEFTKMVENTDVSMSMTLGMSPALEPTSLELSMRTVAILKTAAICLKSMLTSTHRANLSDRYPRNGFSFFMSALHRRMSILSQWRCESMFPMSLCGAQQFEIVKDMLFRALILLRRCFDAMTMD
jgi:hypothetical protein